MNSTLHQFYYMDQMVVMRFQVAREPLPIDRTFLYKLNICDPVGICLLLHAFIIPCVIVQEHESVTTERSSQESETHRVMDFLLTLNIVHKQSSTLKKNDII
jgi:hypothetical protein